MNGVLLVNKDKGITSHSAISKVKRILNVKKIGHAGTLDPLATGLLVVMLGSATKLSNYLMAEEKEYVAEILIGQSTDTLDSEGNILEEKEVLEELNVDEALKSFLGKSMQVPPMFSAIKQKGKKLYELARKGIEVEREPREIEIFEIERISEVVKKDGFVSFSFRVIASKGTYIRTLCEDIGKYLGYPAHMVNLKRIKIGNLKLEDASSISEIESGDYKLIKMQAALKNYKIIEVDNKIANLIKNGVTLYENQVNSKDETVVFTYNDELIGIYKNIDGKYKAERVWN